MTHLFYKAKECTLAFSSVASIEINGQLTAINGEPKPLTEPPPPIYGELVLMVVRGGK